MFKPMIILFGFWTISAFSGTAIRYAAEFEDLPVEDFGAFSHDCSAESEVVRDWPGFYPEVTAYIDADKVRELSVYAKKEMSAYIYIPSPEPTDLWVYGCNEHFLVYETTLDQLPAHISIVYRYLKAYIVSARGHDQLLPQAVIYAVRGHVLE